jgi:endonuclease/exonuclease/phosphatase family metal-dependent hydrolase
VSLRLVSYNIRYGGTGREQALGGTIQKLEPDVVLLQEATHPAVVEKLARATGMTAWGSLPGHSVGYMSRRPVVERTWHPMRGSRRTFLELVLAEPDVRLIGVHLTALHSNWMERQRVRELRALLAGIAGRETNAIVAGDFNTLAPGEELDLAQLPRRLRVLAWLTGRKIRWETIQIMLDAGFLDAFRMLHPDDAGHTFPTWRPHVRLDFVFVPGSFAGQVRRCEVAKTDGGTEASDHFPLVAELGPGAAPAGPG